MGDFISQEMIVEVTKRVLESLEQNSLSLNRQNGIFPTMGEAVQEAWVAQKRLVTLTLKKREELIQAMREAVISNARTISELAVRESGMGRVEDKIAKNILSAEKTPGTEDLITQAYSGDHGLTIMEQAPFGVIGAITPVTNPTATVINNSIGMLAAGNSVVFNPHPRGKMCSLKTIAILNEAIISRGGPPNVLTAVEEPTIETARQMMQHPKILLLTATGGPGVVRVVLSSGKRAIGAGAGNPPVVVDQTANLVKAAQSIIAGASFDNNLPCIAEKEIIAVDQIADPLLSCLRREGALVLDAKWIQPLTDLLFTRKEEEGRETYQVNTDYVGKDVSYIMKDAGMDIAQDIRLAVIEVGRDHPLFREEQLMPIIPLVRVKNVDEAIELAVEVENGNRHSAMMHSTDVNNMTRLARSIQTTLFVKNAPSYAGIGLGGEGCTTFTIAGPTGEGLTSARCFTRLRRCVLVDALSIL
jgi:propionaldehyde dehydrogenase